MGVYDSDYGVATTCRLLKITGLFCRIQSLLQGSFAKETYNFKEPTHRSHPIQVITQNDGHLMGVIHLMGVYHSEMMGVYYSDALCVRH